MNNIEDVKKFLKDCIYKLGMGFHPDTDFNDYIEVNTDKVVFPAEQAERLNVKMEQAFKICEQEGEEIYKLGLEILNDFRIHEVIQKAVSDIATIYTGYIDEAMDGDETDKYINCEDLTADMENTENREEQTPSDADGNL
jgi:hypothetical protein